MSLPNPVRAEEWALLMPCMAAAMQGEGPKPSMLEFGNKLNTRCGPRQNQRVVYKDWFVQMGWQHVSVDTNGLDGALPIDLRKDLRAALRAADMPLRYDIVTNIGTTEHVEGQQDRVWRNLWEAVKPGGWLLSITPAPGQWQWHGHYYPTLDFYQALAALNRFEMGTTKIGSYGTEPRINHFFVGQRVRHPDDDLFEYPGDGYIYRNFPGAHTGRVPG